MKSCFCEKNPDYVIFHVGTNELNSELPPEIIAKSIIDVAKSTQSDSRIVSISGIIPRNGNFNIEATEVNKELSKMCDKEKLLFVSHSKGSGYDFSRRIFLMLYFINWPNFIVWQPLLLEIF